MSEKEIAIFVSHRIDLDSVCVDLPIYHHMRCGAVYDANKNPTLLGDNTGDNISERRNSFCELTVQYWAWKNYEADYYGLCHYRRYFSFSNKNYVKSRNVVHEQNDMKASIKKYCLDNESKIKRTIADFDVIIPQSTHIKELVVFGHIPESVYDFWKHKEKSIDLECLKFTVEVVRSKHGRYFESLQNYLNGTSFWGSLCYVFNKNIFNEFCEFVFSVLFEIEKEYAMPEYSGDMVRQLGFMGEILYGAYIVYLKTQKELRIKELQLVMFSNVDVNLEERHKKQKGREMLKNIKRKIRKKCKAIGVKIFPSYRVARRIENKMEKMLISTEESGQGSAVAKEVWRRRTLTSNENLSLACFANEICETHKASFSEFRRCNTGKKVVVLATGPSMQYYKEPIDAVHIGMNKAFKNNVVDLDFYFTTDYESKNDWFKDLKNCECIKFFGQYSIGEYRDRFQVTEQLIADNNARRFFQGAPNEDIHINIEYHPLMGFYSIAFQALHFAIYTNAKCIYLVGCDCSSDGYFDGTTQLFANIEVWKRGYLKFKDFVERFYPETEIISINPVGLKGMFRDVYTESYLNDHPEINRDECEILK